MESHREKIKKGWIHCHAIIEILGKPKEYIDEVLRALVEKIKREKPIEVIKEKFSEPKDHGSYFTSFVEIEMVLENMKILQEFIFSYMPSSVEIISPSELKINMNDANYLFNDLAGRLHGYDDITKQLKAANILLTSKLKQFIPNLSEKDFEDMVPETKDKTEEKKEKSD